MRGWLSGVAGMAAAGVTGANCPACPAWLAGHGRRADAQLEPDRLRVGASVAEIQAREGDRGAALLLGLGAGRRAAAIDAQFRQRQGPATSAASGGMLRRINQLGRWTWSLRSERGGGRPGWRAEGVPLNPCRKLPQGGTVSFARLRLMVDTAASSDA